MSMNKIFSKSLAVLAMIFLSLSLTNCDLVEDGNKSRKDTAQEEVVVKTTYQQNKEKDALDDRPVYDRYVEGMGKEKTDQLYEELGQGAMDLLSYGAGVSNVISLVNIISDVNKLIAMVGNDYATPATGLGAVRIIALINTIDAQMLTNTYSGAPPANQDTIGKLAALVNGLSVADLTDKVVGLINGLGITRSMGGANDTANITKMAILVSHIGDVNKLIGVISSMSVTEVTVKLKDVILGTTNVENIVAIMDSVSSIPNLVQLLVGVTDAGDLTTIINNINSASASKLGALVDNVTSMSALSQLVNGVADPLKMAHLINEMEDGSTWSGQVGGAQVWAGVLTTDKGIDRLKDIVNTLASGTAAETTANVNKLVRVLDGVSDMTKMMRIIQDLANEADIATLVQNLPDPATNAVPSQVLAVIVERVSLANMPRMVTMVNGQRSVSAAAQTAFLNKLDTVIEGVTLATAVTVAEMVEGISSAAKVVTLVNDVANTARLVTVINGVNLSSASAPNHTAVSTLIYVVDNLADMGKLVTVVDGVADITKVVTLVNAVAAGSQTPDATAAGQKLNTIIGGVTTTTKLITVLDGANATKMAALLNALAVASSAKVVTLVNDISDMSKLVELVNNVSSMTEMATMVDTITDSSKLVTMVNGTTNAANLTSLVNAIITEPTSGIPDVVAIVNGLAAGDIGKLTALVNALNGSKDILIAQLLAPQVNATQGVGTAEMIVLISGLTNASKATNMATLLTGVNATLSYLGVSITQREGFVRLIKAGVTYNTVTFPGLGGAHIAVLMNNVASVANLTTLLNSLGLEQMAPLVGCVDRVTGFQTPCTSIGQGWISSSVVINEIAWMGTTVSANNEWIELYNTTGGSISLSGWTLDIGGTVVALSGTIGANSYFLMERTSDNSVPGIAADLIYTGAMSNTGAVLTLKQGAQTMDTVDQWHAGESTSRATMARISSSSPGTNAGNWMTAALSYSGGFGTPKGNN